MQAELIRMTATEAVGHLRRGEVTPLELIDAAAARIAVVEPSVNALPTLCLDRARDGAKRLMAEREPAGDGRPGWLAGLPVVIKDLMDVAGVRTTYGSPLFRDHVPASSHPLVRRIEALGGIVIGKSNTPEFGAGGNTFNEVFGPDPEPVEHGADLRRFHGWRRRGGRDRRGVAGAGLGPWGFVARAGDAVLRRGDPPLARPRDARHREQSVLAPVGAGADGAQRARPRPVPRHHGRPLPVRPTDLRRPRPQLPGHGDRGQAAAPGRLHRQFRRPSARRPRDAGPVRRAVRLFEQAGCVVEEAFPELGPVEDVFLALRSQHFVVDRELQIAAHRDQINRTSSGTPSTGCRNPPAAWPGPSGNGPHSTAASPPSSNASTSWSRRVRRPRPGTWPFAPATWWTASNWKTTSPEAH